MIRRTWRGQDSGPVAYARLPVGATADTVAAGDDPRIVGALQTDGGGTITGDLAVEDAAGEKNYGLRSSGGSLDFDAAGADLFVSTWSGAGNTGDQRTYMRLESGAALAHAVGRWLFAASPFAGGGVADLDAATGVAGVGGKNGLGNIRFCGYKATGGAPGTGTWAAGDLIVDSAGVWHLCTGAGTPGTWT
jgi:hypothetical protein